MEPCECNCWVANAPWLFDGIGTYILAAASFGVIAWWRRLTKGMKSNILWVTLMVIALVASFFLGELAWR